MFYYQPFCEYAPHTFGLIGLIKNNFGIIHIFITSFSNVWKRLILCDCHFNLILVILMDVHEKHAQWSV